MSPEELKHLHARLTALERKVETNGDKGMTRLTIVFLIAISMFLKSC